jgi:ABC-type sugar transport system permease subunit
VVGATSWQILPFFILMFLSGLQMVPKELHEAAHIDGANGTQRFRYITAPAIRSISSVSSVLGVLSIFRAFEIIWLMTGGGPLHATEVLSISLYREAFIYYDVGRASVFGVTTLLLSTGVLVSFWPLVKQKFF